MAVNTLQLDVTILGRWGGYSFPAPPVVILTFVVVGIMYTLVPAGRPRTVAKALAPLPVGLLVVAELPWAIRWRFSSLSGRASARSRAAWSSFPTFQIPAPSMPPPL